MEAAGIAPAALFPQVFVQIAVMESRLGSRPEIGREQEELRESVRSWAPTGTGCQGRDHESDAEF